MIYNSKTNKLQSAEQISALMQSRCHERPYTLPDFDDILSNGPSIPSKENCTREAYIAQCCSMAESIYGEFPDTSDLAA